jgi:GDPmannose 4,6-dehydratase
MKTALIFGVSGQDGAYLARLLADRGYAVHGTSRDAHRNPFPRLHLLGIRDRIALHSLAPLDAVALRTLLARVQPDEIYNLSGLSSVARSFAEPESAWSSIVDAHALLLETTLAVAPRARVYHSASSECFGAMPAGASGNEETPFAPRSPYAQAKAAAYELTRDFRARGLFAVSGLVFNHESPLRGETFVTKKIITSAAAIASGQQREPLLLGDLSAARDWGYAGEYVDAMHRMLLHSEPHDFVLATGESHTVEEFAIAAFAAFGLDHRRHIAIDPALLRPADIRYNRGDASRAKRVLGWSPSIRFHALVSMLASACGATTAEGGRRYTSTARAGE